MDNFLSPSSHPFLEQKFSPAVRCVFGNFSIFAVNTIKYNVVEMDNIELKASTSIRIDASVLEQIRSEARAENRSLSNYIETLLYRMGYRPYNAETAEACIDAKSGRYAGSVDTTTRETIEASLFGNEEA